MKKYWIWLSWILVSLFKASYGQEPGLNLSDFSHLYHKGTAAYQDRKLDSASWYFTAHLSLARKGQDTLAIAHTYRELGRVHRRMRHFDQALSHYDQAISLFTSLRDSMEIAIVHYNMGNVYHDTYQYPEALTHYDQAFRVFNARKNTDYLTRTLNNKGNIYLSMGNYPEAETHYQQILTIIPSSPSSRMYALASNNLALIAKLHGNYNEALGYHEQAVSAYKFLEDEHGLATSYASMGNIYSEWGDDIKGLEYLFQSSALFDQTQDPLGKAYALNSIALIYADQKRYEQAHSFHQQALAIRIAQQERMDTGISLLNLGILYDEMDQEDKAIAFHEQAMAVFEELDDQNNLAYTLNSLGTLYKTQQEYPKAMALQQEALAIFQEMGDREGEILCWHETGELYQLQGQYEAALTAYRKGSFVAGIAGLSPGDICGIPRYSAIRLPLEMLESYTRQAELFYHLSQEEHTLTCDTSFLRLSFLSFQAAIGLVIDIRQLYTSDIAQLKLSGKIRPMLEQALEVTYRLYAQTHSPAYLNAGFEIMEHSKSLLLLDALRQAEAWSGTAGRDHALYTQFRQKAARLHYLEINSAPIYSDPDKYPEQDALFALRLQYDSLFRAFKQQVPLYAHARFGRKRFPLSHLEQSIPPQAVLFEYFTGEKAWYLFAHTAGRDTLIQIPISQPIRQHLDSLIQELGAHPFSRDRAQAFQAFTRAAYSLYQTLLAPVRSFLQGKQRLMIAPDGPLSQLPFGVLLSESPSPGSSGYKGLSYIIQDYPIQYIPSVDLWDVLQTNQNEAKYHTQYLAFTPFVSPHQVLVPPLPGSMEEISVLQQHWDGEVLTDQQATKLRFQERAQHYGIIHLSTHGRADSTDIRNSFLLFADQDSSGRLSRLFTHELYSMHLQAQLVALSACESGSGVWQDGEGVISLGRGFMFAGASSVVMSLWRVNEQATTNIFQWFYGHLAKGRPKPEALAQAKRTYLQTCRESEAHPFFWGGIVMYGNGAPVSPEKSYERWLGVAGLILVGMGLFFYGIRRRNS